MTLLTPKDLSRMLGISIWTVYAATSKRNRTHTKVRVPPWIKIGRLVRWRPDDVEVWLHRLQRDPGPDCQA